MALARTPPLLALVADPLQALLQLLDALADEAAIQFQLRLARTAQADAAAALPLQVGPAAHQARGHVPVLGQLHLQLAFEGAGALGEDVQDEAGAIQHPAAQELLQVAFLAGAEGVVDQHQIGAERLDALRHFLRPCLRR